MIIINTCINNKETVKIIPMHVIKILQQKSSGFPDKYTNCSPVPKIKKGKLA